MGTGEPPAEQVLFSHMEDWTKMDESVVTTRGQLLGPPREGLDIQLQHREPKVASPFY